MDDQVESEDVDSLRDVEGFQLIAPPREPTAGKLDFSPDAVFPAVVAALAAGLPESPEVCGDAALAPAASAAERGNGAGVTLHALGSLKPLGQLRESFILATNEEGLWIIDQHVAHERVLFERVLRESKTKQVQQQRLLMPMLVELTPAQMVAFAEIAAELERNGFEAEPFGPRTLAVKAAPVGLQGRELERMLTEVLEQHERTEQRENLEALRTRIAASIACHAAVKVNMPLDRTRMEWLLQELGKTEHPTSCPHGRPIALRYSWKDIERAFHRI
jgi:DNA mismatch repair protein MutL